METKNPTVAVVMCTYNGEKYLREQMDSILAQTYPIHEIIVQDDRSTDGSARPPGSPTPTACATTAPCSASPPGRCCTHTSHRPRPAALTWPCRTAWRRSCCARACPPCCACCACACATLLSPPPARARGWRGAIRGFFYPFIFAWHCSQFDME